MPNKSCKGFISEFELRKNFPLLCLGIMSSVADRYFGDILNTLDPNSECPKILKDILQTPAVSNAFGENIVSTVGTASY